MNEQVEAILQEASAHGLRNEVVTMAENIKTIMDKVGVIKDFTEERIYQEAFDVCLSGPDYFEYYIKNFKQ